MSELEDAINQLIKISPNSKVFTIALENLLNEKLPNEKIADFLTQGGLILRRNDQIELALNLWHRALVYYEKFPCKQFESDCCLCLGDTYQSLVQYQEAIEYHNKALEIKQEIGDREGEATCDTNLGTDYHFLGQHVKAIEYYNKALEIALQEGKLETESQCYGNLGNEHQYLGQYHKTIEYQNKALEITKITKNEQDEASSYLGLGGAFDSIGEYQKAIENNIKALEIFKKINHKKGEATCDTNLGNVYQHLGQYHKTIEYQNKALEITKEMRYVYEESVCYANLGSTYQLLGQYENAIDNHIKALEIFQKIDNKNLEATSYTNIGSTCYSLEKYEKAIEHHIKALEIKQEIGDKEGEGICYANLGITYHTIKQYKKAIEYHIKALEIFKEIQDRHNEAVCYANLGQTYSSLGQIQNSIENLEKAIEMNEKLGKRILEDNQKITFYDKNVQTYKLIIENYLHSKNYDKAFEYIERSKSKSFLDILDNTKNSSSQINRKNKHINNYEQNLHFSVEQSRKYFSDKTILVEYYIMEQQLYIFVISDELYTIPITISKKDIIKIIDLHRFEIEKCTSSIKNNGTLPDNEESLRKIMKELGEILLVPIWNQISKAEEVYFVPHDLLHYIPIHSLLSEDNMPLIENKPVAYLPSVSILQFLKEGKIKNFETGNIYSATKNDDKLELKEMMNDEAKKIGNLFKSNLHIDATKEEVLKSIENQCDFIHFSCHGFFYQKDPLSSGILLHSLKEPTEKDFLTAEEIFNLKLNVDLVTLSACETGLSKISHGDEIIGLSRAFFYAGVSSLIVSLWSPDTAVTKELMSLFYSELKINKTNFGVATALQNSQKILMKMKNYSHPYLWAPFIVIGNK